MANPNSTQLQDLLDATGASTDNTTTSESEDMEFEPATEEESDDADDGDFLQRLLAGEEGGDMEGRLRN
jgi:hypothetical protein